MIGILFYDSRSTHMFNIFDEKSQETFTKKHPDKQMCVETTNRYHETLSMMEREGLKDIKIKHNSSAYQATNTSWYRMLLVPIPDNFQTKEQIMMFMESVAYKNNLPYNGTWMNYYLELSRSK